MLLLFDQDLFDLIFISDDRFAIPYVRFVPKCKLFTIVFSRFVLNTSIHVFHCWFKFGNKCKLSITFTV